MYCVIIYITLMKIFQHSLPLHPAEKKLLLREKTGINYKSVNLNYKSKVDIRN